jgi:hypothetical protein
LILSYARQFAFIHVIKVAGMSIEKALLPYDVRTQMSNEGFPPAVLNLKRHTTAAELRDIVGTDAFAKLFKFAFVRNPWDFELSLYEFNRTHPEFPAYQNVIKFANFEDYMMARKRETKATGIQLRYVADADNKVIVDFVGRFETLARDFAEVCAKIGVQDNPLEKINATAHKPWQTYYTPAMFDLVREMAAVDIEAFGYSPNPADYGM